MEIKPIQKLFNEVIDYSQGISEPKTDKLFEAWYTAKSYFINHLFNGELIYEFPHEVTFKLNEETKSERFGDFIVYVYRLSNAPLNDDLFRYFGQLSPEEFFNNTLSPYI